jgi:hypothetical protein
VTLLQELHIAASRVMTLILKTLQIAEMELLTLAAFAAEIILCVIMACHAIATLSA